MTATNLTTARQVKAALQALADPEKAKSHQRFFKTGPGEYSHGDVFLGVTVPQTRSVVRRCDALPDKELETLLQSRIHEHRLLALLVMVRRYKKNPEGTYQLFLTNKAHVNNWDLVDSSARDIVGAHLFTRDRAPLYKLAKSKVMWDRRIAIIATHFFIKRGELQDTFALAERLLKDTEDLMHKATGWTLREAGKKDEAALVAFLTAHGPVMPRTMLRYAIEKFDEARRKGFLAGDTP